MSNSSKTQETIRTIKDVERDIIGQKERLDDLYNEGKELYYQAIINGGLRSKDRFEEKVETHPKPKYARKPHPLNGVLVGRYFWTEEFVDEDSGESVFIERSQIVRENGEWVISTPFG